MRFSNGLIVSVTIAIVTAKIINVDVGQNGLVFEPNTTTAVKGDIISFTFFRGVRIICMLNSALYLLSISIQHNSILLLVSRSMDPANL